MSSSRAAARAAAFLGALALLAVPAAFLAAQFLAGVGLLKALYVAAPVACGLGLIATIAARRALASRARSIRPEASGPVRMGRTLAYTGLYVGVTSALALAVYGVLRFAQ
jgi:hypothetical protein